MPEFRCVLGGRIESWECPEQSNGRKCRGGEGVTNLIPQIAVTSSLREVPDDP
jgi:hypothetical protein